MILTFDIGNTRATIGLFDNSSNCCVKTFFISSKDLKNVEVLSGVLVDNIGVEKISGAIIGSVVKDSVNSVCDSIKDLYDIEPIVLSYQSKLPISLCVDEPEKLGVDRIINGAFAYYKYNKAVIVIDCGSAITFDIVDNDGNFVGGIISLGLKNQLKSLYSSTSALPSIELDCTQNSIGSNTKDAIMSGVVNGTASMIDGMLKKCSNELGIEPVVVLTGGDSEFLSKFIKYEIVEIDSKFTLKGLNYLYDLNCSTLIS